MTDTPTPNDLPEAVAIELQRANELDSAYRKMGEISHLQRELIRNAMQEAQRALGNPEEHDLKSAWLMLRELT